MEIKNRYTGAVILTVEGADMRGADLREAILSEANLRGADLRGADMRESILSWADLRGADMRGAILSEAILREANMRGAILSGALLSGAELWGCIGNGIEVKSLQCGTYDIAYTAEVLQIGCQRHKIEDWWAFHDRQIAEMDSGALDWWRVWKPLLQAVIAASPAEPTEAAR